MSKEDQVEDIELLNPYNLQDYLTEKLSIIDVKARSTRGELYNVEIQVNDARDYEQRALLYWAKLYTKQLKTGESYHKLKKAIGIHILNFTSIPNTDDYHNKFNMKNQDNKDVYFKHIELHTIELKKFEENKTGQYLSEDEEINLFVGKIKTSLDKWVTFLTRYDLLESNKFPAELKNSQLEKALNALHIMNFDKKEGEIYEGHLRWLRDEADAVLKAEEKRMKKGIAKGMEKGRAESEARIVKNMFKKGIGKLDISSMTGVSISEIDKIINEV